MSRPISITIDSTILKNNLSIIRKISFNSKLWAVVKSNAYGHGIRYIWKLLLDADGFALVELEDALFLRKIGYIKPILLLEGFFEKKELEIFDRYNLISCIHSEWQIDVLEHFNFSAPLDIYVKFNSGMNRFGFDLKDFLVIWNRLSSLKNVGNMTMMTHFVNIDDFSYLKNTRRCISSILDNYKIKCCFANSAVILFSSYFNYDWVRSGILLYGLSPTGNDSDISNYGLKPVMTFSSKIIFIRDVNIGDILGYGNYIIKEKKRIGIVACGYSDGYPRNISISTPVLVDGVITKTIGLISMDTLIIDLTCCPKAHIGSNVELWGNNISIDKVACMSNTISYELISSLSSRIPILLK
ncbi:alanine racemase [Candidatus Purcelliella pentastirinorum]|uniref:alanine racemase n=1 Tax=Candidatus Purcelliella pentastirinorum TaxID=472834 RepID=UPI00237A7705|nr:alanine racemase [Candidatus Purcelliella pentastirinorum]WDR80425.1 alanine racemase [Candidatus Purcelliella pentastirinorum]